MNVQVKELDNSQIELTIEVPYDTLTPQLEKASKRISGRVSIPGFRKGQVPFSVLKTKFSEGGILEEATNDIVVDAFMKAVTEKKLETLGQPKIEVKTAAPGNPFVFTATVAVLPEMKLPALDEISVKKEVAELKDEEVAKTLEDLRKMRAKEKNVKREAKQGDKVVVDFDVKRGNVAIEGGSAKKQPVMIGESRFIPGFEEQLVGAKSGDEKTFELTFPKEYHEKSLAGKPATFEVKVHDIFEIELPELNEEFAKSLGDYKSMDDVKEQVKGNMQKEKDQKAQDQTDMKIVEALVEKTDFGTLPEMLFEGEVEKMFNELKYQVMNNGGKIEDYLSHLKKTEDELKKDLRPDAEKRVKTGLVIRQIGKQENIEATDEETQNELEKTLKTYAQQPGAEQQFNSPQYKEHLKMTLTNRKIFEFLRSKTVQ